jgi:uncharacterized protein
MRPRSQGRAPAVCPANGTAAPPGSGGIGGSAFTWGAAGPARLHRIPQDRQCGRSQSRQAPAARGGALRHAGPRGRRPRLCTRRPGGRADMPFHGSRSGFGSCHGGIGARRVASLGRAIGIGIDHTLSLLLRGLVLVYRYLVSPFMPHGCRYAPSCSAYALEALERHGAVRGGWLAARRLLRCHPWGGSGYDPVPTPSALSRRVPPVTRRSHPSDASEPIGPPA